MGYVTGDKDDWSENWFNIKRADPHNEQVAAATSRDIGIMIQATQRALDDAERQGATEVEAMAAMATSMKEFLDEGILKIDTVVNILCLALVRLTGKGAPTIELPPLD